LKDRRAHLKHVFSVKHRSRTSHAPLKKSDKLLCPHGCEAGLQLATENSVEQLWSCNGCHSLLKVKRGENR